VDAPRHRCGVGGDDGIDSGGYGARDAPSTIVAVVSTTPALDVAAASIPPTPPCSNTPSAFGNLSLQNHHFAP